MKTMMKMIGSRNPYVISSLLLLRVLCVSAFISGCGKSKDASTANELNLFAWSEYVPQELLDGFTKETGIKVNYETYGSNEEMLSKLLAGGSQYDVIQPSEYTVEALAKDGKLEPLDIAALSNIKNIDPAVLHLPFDPEQKWSVPYMTGTIGIVVNTEKVKEPIRSYKDVFQKQHAGRIVVVNDSRELVSWALAAQGLPINDVSPGNLAKVRPMLRDWIRMVKVFDSDSPKTKMISGDCDLGVMYNGEAALCINEDPKKFAFVLPSEDAHAFIDNLCVVAGAPHKEAAMKFLNYVLRPEVSKLISDKFPYTNPNLEARKLLTPAQLNNPASYPKGVKMDIFHDIGPAAADVDKLVTDLKSGAD